jgi:hypothetical protein
MYFTDIQTFFWVNITPVGLIGSFARLETRIDDEGEQISGAVFAAKLDVLAALNSPKSIDIHII